MLAAFLKTVAHPWLSVGEFNVEPAELETSGWLQQVQGSLLLQRATATYFQGVACLFMDMAVASPGARRLVQACRLANVPWRSHIGLEMELLRQAPPPALLEP